MPRRLLLVDARASGPLGLDRLRARGATVESVESIERATDLLRRGERYDAVLVSTTGHEVTLPALDALAAHGARVVLVVREGETSPAERVLLETDAYPFTFEPIDPEQLEAEVETGRPSGDLRPSLSI